MDDWATRLSESPRIQAVFGIVGLLSAVIRLIAFAFPGTPDMVAHISTGFLILALLFLAYPLFVKVRGVLSPRLDEENVHLFISGRYGMGYASIQVDCHISENGSAVVRREVDVEAFCEIDSLDTFLLVPESAPDDRVRREANHIEVRSLTPGRDVYRVYSRREERTLSSVIGISPRLVEGDSVTYELKERLPRGLFAIDLDEEALRERRIPDYFGWRINRPTKKLTLNVHFPEAVKPHSYDGEVRYAAAAPGLPSERQQRLERNRLSGPFLVPASEENHYTLVLSVDYPTIGLIYIINWQPPKPSDEATEPTE
jgi:hypothetical protein